jgi:hypothetical protein
MGRIIDIEKERPDLIAGLRESRSRTLDLLHRQYQRAAKNIALAEKNGDEELLVMSRQSLKQAVRDITYTLSVPNNEVPALHNAGTFCFG